MLIYGYTTVSESFSSSTHLPFIHRHFTGRTTAHMAENGAAPCCRCCCSFIFTSGLTALFMWLSLRTSKPTCSIQHFYVPALNLTDNSTAARSNHSIYFDLKLDNGMKDKGVHYANISLTFSYYNTPNNSRLLVGNYTVPEFHQGHGKTAHRRQLIGVSGLPWAAALDAVSNGATVSFRVDLATRVKFKIMFWYTPRRSLVVGGDVAVDASGEKVKKKKGVKLKSGAPNPRRSHWVRLGFVAVFTFLTILLL